MRDTPDPSSSSAEQGRGFRKLVTVSLVLSAISVALSALALLFATGTLPLLGQASFERQARAYILANPETIVQSVNTLQSRQAAAEESEGTAALTQRRAEVFEDPASPIGANAHGDVTLVEFFDYNCPYCRKAAPILDDLEQADKGLRLVFKEFPILGAGSAFAARAALASQKQGKYLAFHKAMMTYSGQITESSAMEIATSVGLDVERLKKDMNEPAIDDQIKRNLALAEALHISGTPTFIAGKEIVRSLVDTDTMKRVIATARKG
ncbi:DsbA family protein [Hyphomicrobium sp.]|uniref:DsbA family protein n=1 Tax=Hyphomicrobium sp. TaxID=82 RepID=UPI000FB39E78|nr:DsbA family protein [Hyphomicrobium sp.]RUO99835.1 MAG: DsbA family protein [Hyphomicrobium sp.]